MVQIRADQSRLETWIDEAWRAQGRRGRRFTSLVIVKALVARGLRPHRGPGRADLGSQTLGMIVT